MIKTVDQVFKEVEFPRDWHKEVKDIYKIGIDFSTSPYDFEAVDLCEKLSLLLKLDLRNNWLEMIEYVAKNMPIIMATGDACRN